mgnify:CR=1 FL=1
MNTVILLENETKRGLSDLMTSRVTILGDGQMGLVLADALHERGIEVIVWGPFKDHVKSLASSRVSPRLPSMQLPKSILVMSDKEAALSEADCVVNAIPTQFVRGVWQEVKPFLEDRVPIGCVAKGIEIETLMLPTQIIEECVGDQHSTCVLSGPTIASELVLRKPAALVSSSSAPETASYFQDLFDVSWLRLYTHHDPLGVELAGALKNVIAIAAGICDGMSLGDNAKSAMLSRGLAEISRLGVAMGAQLETFFGVAGVGDLATTCFSPYGRNRTCGERLGRGESLFDIESSMGSVVEGVATTKAVRTLATTYGIDMPISEMMYQVLYHALPLNDAIYSLMSRDQKEEHLGK